MQQRKLSVYQLKVITFLGCALAFLGLWALLGAFYEETPSNSTIDQFKVIWLTLSVVAISIYLVSQQIISFATLLKTVVYANFLYSCVKVAAVVLHLLGVFDVLDLMTRLGMRFMSMQIVGTLFRLQLSNDIVTPFILFFVLQSEKFGIHWSKKFRTLYFVISIFAIFLSFSRFLIAAAALGAALHVCTWSLSRVIRAIPVFLLIMFMGAAWIGMDNLYTIVERRILSSDNEASDQTRTEQIASLVEESEKFPFFGKGLGGYVPNYIRDDIILHSYEVQWVAFLMQFGIVGLLLVIAAFSCIALNFMSLPITRRKLAFLCLFLVWLLSGFTNPFLVSLASGIVYSLFYLSGRELSIQERCENHC
ncbi:MAG: O-antigen ligase family protein [Parachlamydiaceae bacterium]|nr:O-antigen ligase family protein [Parachlamydiaceae bacterium]